MRPGGQCEGLPQRDRPPGRPRPERSGSPYVAPGNAPDRERRPAGAHQPEAALYGHWMEWRESNRSGRPLSMGDALRLTGAGSAMSLRSSAPALLHALSTRYPGDGGPVPEPGAGHVPGGSVRAGCGAPPSAPAGRGPGGGRNHGIRGRRGRGAHPPPADQPGV